MTAQLKKSLLAAMMPLTLLTAVPIQAQTSEDGKRVYEAAYFESFAPQTAFDMIRRLPGFQLRGGNNARGLGQGGANILVNGQQIVGKGGDPFGQVDRIPATDVVRLEIIDGTTLDIPGLAGQVVNVISETQKGVSGSWEWIPEWRQRQQPNLLRGSVKVSGETGNVTYAAELRNRARRNGDYGPESRRNADGSLYELRQFAGRYNVDSPGGTVNLTWKPTEDRIGNLNLEYNLFNFNRNSTISKSAIDVIRDNPADFPLDNIGENGAERFNFGEDEWNAKIDGDYEFPFMDGKLKLIGYYRAEHSPTLARFFDYGPGFGLIEQTEFKQTADEGEAIAKTEYSWSPKEGRDWQISLEGAYNFLDIENQFSDILTPANSGGLNMLEIDEKRAEGFITHTRKLNDKWSLQASLGAEYSELTAGGTTRKFTRPKGSLSATYTKDETFNVTAKVERQVGQLNFFDFSSSVSLQDEIGDRDTNLNLVPSQNWFGEVAINKTLKDGHSLEIQAHGRLFTDIVDQIPFGEDGSAVGNIGSGEAGGVHFNTTLKGDPWGLDGVELKTNVAWHMSSVTDPITLNTRQFSGMQNSEWNISLRHDIPKSDWAWGFFFGTFENASNYSPFAITRFDQRPGWSEIYIEHKDVLGMKVQAELGSVFETHNQADRIIFTGRRDLAGISRIENARYEYDGPYLVLNISDTF